MENISVLIVGERAQKISLSVASLRSLKIKWPIFVASFDEIHLKICEGITFVRPNNPPYSCPTALLDDCVDFNKAPILRAHALKAIKSDYVLILEEGVCLKSLDFLAFFKQATCAPYPHWLNEKVLIPAARYRLYPQSRFLVPFYFDYWIQAGLRQDLLKLWDFPLLNLRSLGIYKEEGDSPYALPPASAYLLQALKGAGLSGSFSNYTHYTQTNNALMCLSESLLVSCFTVLSPSCWRTSAPRFYPRAKDLKLANQAGFYTHHDIQRIKAKVGS